MVGFLHVTPSMSLSSLQKQWRRIFRAYLQRESIALLEIQQHPGLLDGIDYRDWKMENDPLVVELSELQNEIVEYYIEDTPDLGVTSYLPSQFEQEFKQFEHKLYQEYISYTQAHPSNLL